MVIFAKASNIHLVGYSGLSKLKVKISDGLRAMKDRSSASVVLGLVPLIDDAWIASDVVDCLGGCANIACGEETERCLS